MLGYFSVHGRLWNLNQDAVACLEVSPGPGIFNTMLGGMPQRAGFTFHEVLTTTCQTLLQITANHKSDVWKLLIMRFMFTLSLPIKFLFRVVS